MPHVSLWFSKEWSKPEIQEFMDQVAEIAQDLGYTTHGGPKAGRGNIRALMEALVAGEVVIITREEFDRLNHPE